MPFSGKKALANVRKTRKPHSTAVRKIRKGPMRMAKKLPRRFGQIDYASRDSRTNRLWFSVGGAKPPKYQGDKYYTRIDEHKERYAELQPTHVESIFLASRIKDSRQYGARLRKKDPIGFAGWMQTGNPDWYKRGSGHGFRREVKQHLGGDIFR